MQKYFAAHGQIRLHQLFGSRQRNALADGSGIPGPVDGRDVLQKS